MATISLREWLKREVVKQWYLGREAEESTYYFSLSSQLRADVDDSALTEFIDELFQSQDGPSAGLDETFLCELQMSLNDAYNALVCQPTGGVKEKCCGLTRRIDREGAHRFVW